MSHAQLFKFAIIILIASYIRILIHTCIVTAWYKIELLPPHFSSFSSLRHTTSTSLSSFLLFATSSSLLLVPYNSFLLLHPRNQLHYSDFESLFLPSLLLTSSKLHFDCVNGFLNSNKETANRNIKMGNSSNQGFTQYFFNIIYKSKPISVSHCHSNFSQEIKVDILRSFCTIRGNNLNLKLRKHHFCACRA